MKVVPLADAAPQLDQLMHAALSGEIVVLTDGSEQVQLTPRAHDFDKLDFNSESFKSDLLAGLGSGRASFSDAEMKQACDLALAQKKIA